MQRDHDMPFGAALLPTGEARFRLWAPAAERVELCLEGAWGERQLPMERKQEGWFERITDAAAGTLYRYRIDGQTPQVPDPASRFQPRDVHGPSQVIDPHAFQWQDGGWTGRPWTDAVFYELHVGSFTPEGTFAGVESRLDHLAELGVTAIELMPVADFPGRHDWGYDGVLPFAPDARYGTPEQLKRLVEAAHARDLMIVLDVVYNHFGPEGNYLHLYAPQFFTEHHHTPWGAAINFDDEGSEWVRQFFIDNALYWLEEYHFDGLRLDAVHAIYDDSRPDVLEELAAKVAAGPGRSRHIHLVLENDNNVAHYLERQEDGSPRWYAAQWNDDIHHAAHVLITGESAGYYEDYSEAPAALLGRCLAEGFAYQGEPSRHRNGSARGQPSAHLPPAAFVAFLANHDQVGNRAFGERPAQLAPPEAVGAILSIFLLAPASPLLFMGQEWGSRQPFPFFCDFGDDLAEAVSEGRRREFERFPEFAAPETRARIPDPMAEETFASAVLRWGDRDTPEGRRWMQLHRELLALRRQRIHPYLPGLGCRADYEWFGTTALQVRWRFKEGAVLTLIANLGEPPRSGTRLPAGEALFSWPTGRTPPSQAELGPWSVVWFLEETVPHGRERHG